MHKSLKALAALAMLVTVSACASTGGDVEEFVIADPAPVSVEPTFTGKYH